MLHDDRRPFSSHSTVRAAAPHIDPLERRDLLSSVQVLDTPQLSPTGAPPAIVAAADLNADGVPDLVTASGSATTANVTVLLNRAGFFRARDYSTTPLGVGQPPPGISDIALADVDGDSDVDIVTVLSGQTSGQVFLNDGAGGFSAAPISFSANPGVTTRFDAVAVGDLNGDGKADLAIAMPQQADKALIMAGDGTGHFATLVQLSCGDEPADIALADIDGDGKLDVVTADNGSSQVSLFINIDGGTFAPRRPLSTGAGPVRIAAGDVTGDSKADIVTANGTARTGSLLTNTTSGGVVNFAGPQTLFIDDGSAPLDVMLADLNHDGLADLLFASQTAISVLGSDSGHALGWEEDFATGWSARIAGADLDHDGNIDLAAIAPASNTVRTVLGNGRGDLRGLLTRHNLQANSKRAIQADLNADGLLDLVSAGDASGFAGYISTQLAVGQGRYGLRTDIFIDDTYSDGLAAADVDNDGDQDIILLSTTTTPWLTTVYNDGTGSLGGTVHTDAGAPGVPGSPLPTVLLMADLNADGLPDAIFNNTFNSTYAVIVRFGAVGGGFGATTTVLAGLSNTVGLTIADFDGDGKPDIAAVDNLVNAISVYRNTTGTAFAAPITLSTGAFPAAIASGDLNGDGKPDLVTANATDNSISILRNTSTAGSLAFAAASGVPQLLTSVQDIAIADMNGDAAPDIVVASSSGVRINVGDGVGGFPTFRMLDLGGRTLMLGDIDNDQDRDLAVYGDPDQISIARNYGAGDFEGLAPKLLAAVTGVVSIDLNADSRADAVAYSDSSPTVTVFTNSASGLSPSATITFPAPVDVLRVGDVNGDGRRDLVALEHAGNRLFVSLRGADGSYAAPIVAATGVSGGADLALWDQDGDNRADAAVSRPAQGEVVVLTAQADGTYLPHSTVTVMPEPYDIVWADLDGDGDADMAVRNHAAGGDTIELRSLASGSYNGVRSSIPIPGAGKRIRELDLNNDGKPELVTDSGSTLIIFGSEASSNGRPTYDTGTTLALPAGTVLTDLIIADIAGASGGPVSVPDSIPDLVAATSQDIILLRGQGGLNFRNPESYRVGGGRIASVDFDADTDNDLLAASGGLWMVQSGAKGFTAPSNSRPVITTLTPSAAQIRRAASFTLTATGVSDAETSVASVQFYRDANANGRLDGSDELLATDTNPADGWSAALVVANAWPLAATRFFARPTDSTGLSGPAAVATADVLASNLPPTIASLDAPAAARHGRAMVLTATGVADADGSVTGVSFYRDSNDNGVVDGADQLLGSDTNGADGWSVSPIVQAAWGLGSVRFIAVATDNAGASTSAATLVAISTNVPPVIAGLSAPATARAGESISLSGTGVADSDGSVLSVSFYRDANGNGTFEVGADQLLGFDSSGPDGWTIQVVTQAAWGLNVTFFAIATDNDGTVSTAAAASTAVSPNQAPTVGAVTLRTPLRLGQQFVLLASGAVDPDGTVQSVSFFHDTNRNGTLDAGDTPLGTDSTETDGFTIAATASTAWLVGENTFFAAATDTAGTTGSAAPAILSAIAQSQPMVVSLTPALSVASIDQTLTLSAQLDAASGTVKNVAFYMDTNNNGVFDAGDKKIGSDSSVKNGWTVSLKVPRKGWDLRETRFFAVATDARKTVGPEATAFVTIRANQAPIIQTTIGQVTTDAKGKRTIVMTAQGVSDTDGTVKKLDFYIDANGNGILDRAEKKLGSAKSQGGGQWRYSGALSKTIAGSTLHVLAIASDSSSILSLPRSTDVAIG